MDKRRWQCIAVTENIICVGFNLTGMKTATQHFEHSTACPVATGSDTGAVGHNRKQFNVVMQAAEIDLDDQTKSIHLFATLFMTGLPPHIFVTADKSTVNRVTH